MFHQLRDGKIVGKQLTGGIHLRTGEQRQIMFNCGGNEAVEFCGKFGSLFRIGGAPVAVGDEGGSSGTVTDVQVKETLHIVFAAGKSIEQAKVGTAPQPLIKVFISSSVGKLSGVGVT